MIRSCRPRQQRSARRGSLEAAVDCLAEELELQPEGARPALPWEHCSATALLDSLVSGLLTAGGWHGSEHGTLP